ncbi:MAG: aldo/keto reductase [Candidatus Latescibacteria bacterium]|nr:aldo/keto reductase [Candidatus Latescibacterota bacterium]
MEYRRLGQSGLKVSPICLGTAFRAFWHGHSDEKTCIKTIERAVDLGINFIDCANFYFAGRCETVLGKVLKGLKGKRDDLVITSKVWSRIGEGVNDQGLSRFHIMREVERSLKRLQVDHIDLYLLHNFDPDTPLEETLRAMDDLVRQGKVRYLGACNFTAAQVVDALWTADRCALEPMVCLQNQYNLLHRWEMERELLGRCGQHGLGMMTFSPLAVGLLSGALRRGQQPPEGSPWAQGNRNFDEVLSEQVDDIIQMLIEIGANHSKTPAQVAIAWIVDHPEVTSALIGPDRPEQVDESCGGIGWALSADERRVLDEISHYQLPRKIT